MQCQTRKPNPQVTKKLEKQTQVKHKTDILKYKKLK